MLQAIRKGIGTWVAKAILSVLVLAFALFFGFGDFARTSFDVTVVSVGDHDITASQFQRELRRTQARLGAAVSQQLSQTLLVNLTLDALTQRSLFDQATSRLGLTVSDAVVLEQIKANPAFHNLVGRFDRVEFERALANIGLDEQMYVAASRQDIAHAQLVSSVMSGGVAPRALARAIYKYRGERRVAEIMVIPHSSFSEIGGLDEAAIAEFHRGHPQRFTAPEYRLLTFITLSPEDLAPEIQISEDELREEYDARLGEYVTPERRHVEQIIFSDEETARRAYDRLGSGEDFAEVAAETSGLSADDIDLGPVTKGELPIEVADAVFALAAGNHSEPLKSPFGWHLFRVGKVDPGGTRSLQDVREDLSRELKLDRATDALFELANKLEDELAGGATLEETAARLNLELRHLDAIDVAGRDQAGEPVAGLLASAKFLRAAFEAEAGIETPLTETDEGGYFILRVDRITRPALRPLADVRDEVVAAWTASRRSEAARRKADQVAEKVKGGAEIASLGEELGFEARTTAALTRDALGADPALSPFTLVTLFTLDLGGVTTGKTPAGEGHVVARLKEIRPAVPAADSEAFERLTDNLREAIAEDLLAQFRSALAADFTVSRNQRALDAIVDQGAGRGGF